ncbi:hypothetical protein GJQ54_05535 [Oceanospirillaceae bacterium ASx5O]|nr:hypothetical protein GJQ54_05535 [Oceanospirillaceae bacterium ASx5O]
MRKLMLVVAGLATLLLSGCVLAPQTISLAEQADIQGMTSPGRDALVRVVDEREVGFDVLGHRGGRAPENSPLLADKPLAQALTARLQNSLAALGFGAANDPQPLRVQLTVEEFLYQCNEGIIVNECSISMRFQVTVMDGEKTFTKPYGINEMRSLATSPVKEYSQQWVNDALGRLWSYMFNDAELKRSLGVI